MSKKIDDLVQQNFNPDIHIDIRVDTRNGQMKISSGNGQPLNPLILASVCCAIAKSNIDMVISPNKGKLSHEFLALDGEHRCRVPGCGKIKNDSIHISIPVDDNFPAGKCQGCGLEPHHGQCVKGGV